MNILKIFIIMLSLFLLVKSCFFSTKKKPDEYIFGNKYLDNEYCKELDRMEKCLTEFPNHIFDNIFKHKKDWSIAAFDKIKNILNEKDKVLLIKGNFIECFEIIAEDKANKFVCQAYFIEPGKEDLLATYAIKDYEACIRRKNKFLKNPLKFDIPQIGLS